MLIMATNVEMLFTYSSVNVCLKYVLFCALVSAQLDQHPTPVPTPAGVPYESPIPFESPNGFGNIGHYPSESDDKEVIDAYGLPGVQHEFRIEVPAASFECFFQRLKQNAQLHISFEVLRGADRNIDVDVIMPDGKLLINFQWTNEGTTDKIVPFDGIYQFCIDNRMSRFSSKIVYFYFISYIEADWRKYAVEFEEYQVEVENFTSAFGAIDQNIKKMQRLQSVDIQQLVRDWYTSQDNNSYVQWLALIMCTIVVCTSALQVFFLRKLFSTPKVTPTSKPRA